MGPTYKEGENSSTTIITQNNVRINSKRKKLTCMYTNADQFPNKREDLLTFIADDEPDIIFITEMIPKAQTNPIPKALLDLEGYDMHTNFNNDDEKLGASGIRGVAIYTIFGLDVQVVELPHQHKDQVWIEIGLLVETECYVGVYIAAQLRTKFPP